MPRMSSTRWRTLSVTSAGSRSKVAFVANAASCSASRGVAAAASVTARPIDEHIAAAGAARDGERPDRGARRPDQVERSDHDGELVLPGERELFQVERLDDVHPVFD